MPLTTVVVILIAIAFALWVINQVVPMQKTMQGIVNGVVIIAVLLWLLKIFGVWSLLASIRV